MRRKNNNYVKGDWVRYCGEPFVGALVKNEYYIAKGPCTVGSRLS